MAAELPTRPSWRDRCWMLGHPLVLVGWLVALAFLANELWKVRATSMLGRAMIRLLEKPKPPPSSFAQRLTNPLSNPFPRVWVPVDGAAVAVSSDQSADHFLDLYNGRGGELWRTRIDATRMNDPVLFVWRTRIVETWKVGRVSSVQHFPDEAAIKPRVVQAIDQYFATAPWTPRIWRTDIVESPTTSYIEYDYRGLSLNIVGLAVSAGLVGWCFCVPAWYRRLRRRRASRALVRGFCPVCNYDIAACAASGLAFRCPECGTLNPPRPPPAQPSSPNSPPAPSSSRAPSEQSAPPPPGPPATTQSPPR
jgi:hypothetical protein